MFVTQVNGNNLSLDINQQDLILHFKDPSNYASTILHQINEDGFYNRFFIGKKNLTVLDIGANIGLFSLCVVPVCKKLIAYEPTPSHFLKLNHLVKNSIIETRQMALSDKDGSVDFYLCKENSTMNSLTNHFGTTEKITTKAITLNSILATEKIKKVDFCKIDIEGSEMIAINEDEIEKVKNKIKNFYVEVHHSPNINGKNLHQNKVLLIQIFESKGYKIEDIDYQTFLATKD